MAETWCSNGVIGEGASPPHTVTGDKPLLVVGCGRCVWEDLKRYWKINVHSDVMLLNDAIVHYPMKKGYYATHAACYDIGSVNIYRDLRKAKLNHRDFITHSAGDPADRVWKLIRDFKPNLSGNFGVVIAIAMGYRRICLAGCPEDDTGHYWDDLETHPHFDFGVRGIHWHWTDNTALFKPKVRSLSGWTGEFFGEPTIDWLNGGE